MKKWEEKRKLFEKLKTVHPPLLEWVIQSLSSL